MAVALAPPPTGVEPTGRRHRRRPVGPRLVHFLTFGGPGVAIYVCFVLAPIVVSFGYSLTNYNPFHPPTRFVGVANYKLLFTSGFLKKKDVCNGTYAQYCK